MPQQRRQPLNRTLAFAALCLLALGLAIGYALFVRHSGGGETRNMPAGSETPASAAALADAAARPHLLFRSSRFDRHHGRVGLLPLDRPNASPVMTSLTCQRLHFSSGRGLCLAADRGMVTSYHAVLFDGSYQVRHTVPLGGVPSRARVSPNGTLTALTYFVGGDSYAAAGFSTRTLLVDGSGAVQANLEEFAVTRAGEPFKAVDFNFWGVTFAKEPGRFYATLASGGKIYLVEGEAATRRARVLREGVECPSLSPDNRRIAFKRRMPGIRLVWHIHVLDLETGTETAVAESRSVDDQVEWLDDRTILYALPNGRGAARPSIDIWSVPADGSGAPRLVLADAESPAVVVPPSADSAR